MSTVTDPADIKLLKLLQVEMPVVERPFAALADRVGASEKEVLERVQRLKADGVIRQISAIFDTRSLGYESSLVAARFNPARVDEAATIISRHPGVSHNYLRNHSFNLWFTIAVAPTSKLGLQRTLEILQTESGASALRFVPVAPCRVNQSQPLWMAACRTRWRSRRMSRAGVTPGWGGRPTTGAPSGAASPSCAQA